MEYRKRTDNLEADVLFRLPLPSSEPTVFSEELVYPVQELGPQEQVQQATSTASVLQQITRYAEFSWNCKRALSKEIATSYHVKDNVFVVNNVFLPGERIVVPVSLAQAFTNLAHDTHPRTVCTKQRLHKLCW